MIVAIDGTVCSGKSTVARLLAYNIGFRYVNSGAIYRAFTYKIIKANKQNATEDELAVFLAGTQIDMQVVDGGKFKMIVDGIDITNEINLPYISQNVAIYAKLPSLRKLAKNHQYLLATTCDAVVEGRDIGTEVFPNAEVKFFMTADIDVRANRRFLDYKKAGKNIPLEKVKEEIIVRDKMDMEREVSPLKPSKDAIIYYNNGSDVNAVIKELSSIVLKKKKEGERVW